MSASSQTITISGTTCTNIGTSYLYSVSSTYTNGQSCYWQITGGGGVFTGTTATTKSGTSLNSVSITWGSSGTGSVAMHVYSTPAYSGGLSVSVSGTIVTGTISNTSQTINYNATPTTLSCSAASSGGCSPVSYSYQWQSSPNGVTYTNISGATSQNLTFSAGLTATTYYRRSVSSNYGQSGYSNIATVTVIPPLSGSGVTPKQDIFSGATPTQLTGAPATGGGCSSYSYQWTTSSNGTTFYPISGATYTGTSPTYYSPPSLSQTTYYQYAVTCSGTTAYSAIDTITVHAHLAAGTITSPNDTANYDTRPPQLTATTSTGGICTGGYSYTWQYSTDSSTWTNSDSTGLTYTPDSLLTTTWFRLKTVCGTETVYTNVVKTKIWPQLIKGTLSPTSQTIKYNGNSTAFTVTGTSGGNGVYSYHWQSSTDSLTWTDVITNDTTSTFTAFQLKTKTFFRARTVSNGAFVYTIVGAVNVTAELFAGSLSPSTFTIASGSSPGTITATPTTGGSCGGTYSYQWQNSANDTSWTNISGATGLNYTPGNLTTTNYYRVMIVCSIDTEYTNYSKVSIGSSISNVNLNYIRERGMLKAAVTDTVTADGLTSPYDVQQKMQYFDGVGRPMQTILKQATPLQNDYVVLQTYDPFGRESTNFLPYAANSNDGNYKTFYAADQSAFNAAQFPGETSFYSQINFEASPLDRSLTTYAPGTSWVGSNRGTSDQYLVNQVSDSVRLWTISLTAGSLPTSSGFYAPEELEKATVTDENGHTTLTYTDLLGNVVLRRTQATASPGTGHIGWLNTYYVYDYLNNLRFVIQPQAVVLLNGSWTMTQAIANELCLRYEYDQRKRTIIKKLPGAGETWMVYDARDRMVMSQDSNARALGKWEVLEYDGLNRPVRTGLLTDGNNRAYHQNLATSSTSYPSTSGGGYEVLTQNYYDDYSWVSGASASLGSSLATNNTSNSSYFITSYNASPNYAVPITSYPITRGMVTGSGKEILGTTTGQYLYTVNFYDDRTRTIQTQSLNYTGGVDTTTIEYNFVGKPLRILLGHQKNNNTTQHHSLLTKVNYDAAFRVKNIYDNIDGASSDQLIDSFQYDELSQLRAKYFGSGLDSVIYDYNIRGWLSGINKSYLAGTANHYFGMELAYDKTSSATGTTTFTNTTYNGNIAGTVWKSAGDNVNRKYDFTYDPVNRLTSAPFLQNTTGSPWDNSQIDFSVSGLSYDANGNILTMNQKGFKVGGSATIDSLTYNYINGGNYTNRLSAVGDAANDSASLLGDFHYKGTKQAFDYGYDGNGNLVSDNNKGISTTTYNYLNLPQLLHVNGKGNILYTYDAMGEKVKKVTYDSLAKKSTTTLYIGSFVYQQTDTISAPGSGVDTLQFLLHDQGRIRWAFHKYLNGTTGYGFEYDFFEKDHLGNNRVLLSQEKDTAQYLASMESAFRSTEDQLFSNIDNTGYARNAVLGYPVDTTITNPNDSLIRLNGNGPKLGPGIVLKVMSGDKVDIAVQYFYAASSDTNSSTLHLTDLLGSLATGIVSLAGPMHGSFAVLDNPTTSPLAGAVTSYLTNNSPVVAGKPQAYLNWVLLDNQFNYVSSYPQSGALQVGTAGTQTGGQLQAPLGYTGIPITKSGYLYVYVSNGTPGWDVFFDNLTIKHYNGPLLEENHYYPYGLAMAGISDQAIKTNYPTNKYRFNGANELANGEFSDGSGLELYEAGFRGYDPQLGRFWQMDPIGELFENWSSYSYSFDCPTVMDDPTGLAPTDESPASDNQKKKEKKQKPPKPPKHPKKVQTLPTFTLVGYKKKADCKSCAPKPNVAATPPPPTVEPPLHWLNWPQYTHAEVVAWRNDEWLYDERMELHQPLIQGGESENYLLKQGVYKNRWQAYKDGEMMQYVAISVILGPEIILELGAVSMSAQEMTLNFSNNIYYALEQGYNFATRAVLEDLAYGLQNKLTVSQFNALLKLATAYKSLYPILNQHNLEKLMNKINDILKH